MILSDKSIKEKIRDGCISIVPDLLDYQFQPASIDLRLDNVFRCDSDGELELFEGCSVDDDGCCIYRHAVLPGAFELFSTVESVSLPDDIVGRVEGRSTWARRGLMVHVTAGFVDPGFHGNITLEVYNFSGKPVVVEAGDRICQLVFEELDCSVERPYGSGGVFSKYQGQVGVTRAVDDFKSFI